MHSSLPLTPHQITRAHRNWILFSRSPVGKTKYSQRQHRSYKQEVKGQRDHGLRENLKKSLNVYRSPCQSVRDNFSETFIDSTGFITILWQMKRPPANQFMPVLMFPELRALLLQSSDSFSRPCALLLSHLTSVRLLLVHSPPSTQASLLFRLSSSLLFRGFCAWSSFHLQCSAGQPSPTIESWVPKLLLRGFPLLLFSFCNPVDYSTPIFSVLHYLQGFAQIHVHWLSDAI